MNDATEDAPSSRIVVSAPASPPEANTAETLSMLSGQRALNWSAMRPRWGTMSTNEWRAMSRRMFAPPQSNHAFWDEAEIDVLWDYMTRFKEESYKCGIDENFTQNWINATKAHKFVMTELLPVYVNPCREMGLKEAIRAGKAVIPHATEGVAKDEHRLSCVADIMRHLGPTEEEQRGETKEDHQDLISKEEKYVMTTLERGLRLPLTRDDYERYQKVPIMKTLLDSHRDQLVFV